MKKRLLNKWPKKIILSPNHHNNKNNGNPLTFRSKNMEDYRVQFDAQLDQLNETVNRKLASLEDKLTELNALKTANAELNKELGQVIRQNEFLSAVIHNEQQQKPHFTQKSDLFHISSFDGHIFDVPFSSPIKTLELISERDENSLKRSSDCDLDQFKEEELEGPKRLRKQTEMTQKLHQNLLQLRKENDQLKEEIVAKDVALVTIEEQLLEAQRDFDAQKEECHAHMKVIHRLKNNSTSSTKQPTNNNNDIKSDNVDRFTLQLELVECKRNLIKAQDELKRLKTQIPS